MCPQGASVGRKGTQSGDAVEEVRELGAGVLVPTRLVVSAETAAWMREQVERPPEPTEAMRELQARARAARG